MRDLFKAVVGKSFQDATRIPSVEDSLNRLWEETTSKYPLRDLGAGVDASVLLSEENRAAHIHILGTTREGKSKFLEMLIRHDIDNGYGATLLDPSSNAATAKSVFRYCVSRGNRNVLWIDLADRRIIPTINPLKWFGAEVASGAVASCMDAVQLLWAQNDWQTTTRIQTYLKSLFTVLYFAKCSIPDAEAFSVTSTEKGRHADQDIAELERRRSVIFQRVSSIEETRHARAVLKEVFAKPQVFTSEFRPTIRRLEAFFDPLPAKVFGSTVDTIDFEKIVREKTVLLVSMDTRGVGGDDLRRLLGTVIINGIIEAISYLNRRSGFRADGSPKPGGGWKGRHYLYMDEGGLFATRALADIMAHHGKTGFWATIAHQYFKQFDDEKIIHAIENTSHIKGMFYVGSDYDRNRMLKNMYFGEEMQKQVIMAAANLKKQQMMIRIGKQPAQVFRVQDVVDDDKVTELDIWHAQAEIYKTNSFYRTSEQIGEEINNRFAISTHSGATPIRPSRPKPPTPIRPSAPANHKPQAASGTKDDPNPVNGPDTSGSPGSSVFDTIADSADVLRSKKGRKRTKRDAPPTETGGDI